MKSQLIYLLIFCIGINNLDAQERFLKRAQEEIIKKDLAKAYENLAVYEKKEGRRAEYYYIKACIGANEIGDYLKLDSAFIDLLEAEMQLSKIESDKDKEELCKSIGFCTENVKSLFQRLDSTLSQAYLKNEGFLVVTSFLKKYPGSKYLYEIEQWRNKLAYRDASLINTEDSYQLFISKYPDAIEIEDATITLWKVAYENSLKINSIESFKIFINKYSNAPQVKDAKRNIENIEWNKIKDSKYIDDFKIYISKYPKSENIKLANDKIETLSWNNTLNENSIEVYNKFINQFSTSRYINEAKEKLENISWAAIAESKILSDFEKFKLLFKNSKYLDLANLKIKELKSDVLPYLNKNKKYQLYSVSTSQFIDNNEYDQILILEKGRFLVTKYNKRGIVDQDGKISQQITYDCIGDFKNGFARISIGGKNGFINTNGEIVIQPTLVSVQEVPNRGYLISKEIDGHNYYAFADTLLQITIPFTYDDISIIPDGFITRRNNVKQLLDGGGKSINSFNYSSFYLANEGKNLNNSLFIAESKSKFGVTDYKGRLILPMIYKNIVSDSSGKYYIVTTADNKMSLIDSSKNILIQPGQNIISYLSNGVYVIRNENSNPDNLQVRLFSVRLKKYLNQKPYQDVSSNFSEGLLAVLMNEKVGYINENGDLIIEPIYEKSSLDYSYIGMGGEGDGDYSENNMSSLYSDCSFIDINKYSIEESIWKSNYDFSEGLTVVQIGEKYGYINKKGQIVIPIIYNSANAFVNGLASVTIEENGVSRNKIINTKGEIILNDFNLQTYSKDHKYIFVTKELDSGISEFYKYNISSKELEKITHSFNSVSYYLNYTKGLYNDVEVYLNAKNQVLMSSEIDFSEFESNQLVNKARSYIYDANERDQAIDLLSKAIRLNPNNKSAYLELAHTYKEKDYYNEAIKYFDKAIDIDDDNFDVLSEKASYNYEKKYYREALESYQKMAYKSSQDFSFYFNKGYSENSIGLTDNAIESYTNYINNYQTSSMAYNNRGSCYYKKRVYQKAIDDYTSAIRTGKNESKENIGMFYNNRASCYYYLNKKAEACLDYKRAADLGNSSAINSYRNCK
jgi:tetratricopeptide (TPR) repeat protein